MPQLHFNSANLQRAAMLKRAFSKISPDMELRTVRIGPKKCDRYDPGMPVKVTLGMDRNTAMQTGFLGHGRVTRCEKTRWISIGQSPSDFVDNLDGKSKFEIEQNLKQYYRLSSIGTSQIVSIITFARLQSTP